MASQEPTKRRIVLGAKTGTAETDAGQRHTPLAMALPSSRVLLWQPSETVGTSGPALPLFVTHEVLRKTNEHVSQSPDAEDGGFLLGNWCCCPDTAREFVLIDECSRARYTERTNVSLGFTAEAWGHLGDELTGKFRGKSLVGWYHSHPNWGVFLSSLDLRLHSDRFQMPWMSALVIDPINETAGFFARRPDGTFQDKSPVEFYEVLPSAYSTGKPDSEMPWKNYFTQDVPLGTDREDRTISPTLPSTLSPGAAGQSNLSLQHDAEFTRAPLPKPRCYFWIPQDARTVPQPEYALLVAQEVLLETSKAVSATLQEEIGGFLLGNLYICPNTNQKYAIIDQWSPAKYSEGTSASLAFTPEAWGHLEHELTGKFLGKKLLGWYHSHPKMAVFLSSWDIDLHNDRFPKEWMSALVIVPDKSQAGFFMRRAGKLDPNVPVGFYEYLDAGNVESQPSIMPWNGYVCRDLETGHEFTPRRVGSISNPGKKQVDPPEELTNPFKYAWVIGVAALALLAVFLLPQFFKRPPESSEPPHPTPGLAKLDIVPRFDLSPVHLTLGVVGSNEAPNGVYVVIDGLTQQNKQMPSDRDHVLVLDTTLDPEVLQRVKLPGSSQYVKVDVYDPQNGRLIAEDFLKLNHDDVFSRKATGRQEVVATHPENEEYKKPNPKPGPTKLPVPVTGNVPMRPTITMSPGSVAGSPPSQPSPIPAMKTNPSGNSTTAALPPLVAQQPGPNKTLPDKPVVAEVKQSPGQEKIGEKKPPADSGISPTRAKSSNPEWLVLQKFAQEDRRKLRNKAEAGLEADKELWADAPGQRGDDDYRGSAKRERELVKRIAKDLKTILDHRAPKDLDENEKDILSNLKQQLKDNPTDGIAFQTIASAP